MTGESETREELLERFCRSHGLENFPKEDLDAALTHRSYAFEHGAIPDNERLEFLGDALLATIASEYLYETDPEAREGELSKRRSRLVSRGLLGRRALEMGLGPLLLLGRGERATGGERRRSVLGSALEAVIAVVYLRLGFDACTRFVREQVVEPLAAAMAADALHGDYKSALQEWAQRVHASVPVYHRLSEVGPDHSKQFSVEVEVAGQRLARGHGPRIKIAENNAAREALADIAKQIKH
jgi:ribonuclease-3